MRWDGEGLAALVDAFRAHWVDHPLEVAGALVGSGLAATSGDTTLLFELGSITKTMTATLLGLAVVDGVVSLDDPIERWLAAGANGDITLGQLATHTSGLPRVAPNLSRTDRFDSADPYAAFGVHDLEVGLQEADRTEPGTDLYSNFGYQTLATALERATGRTYAQLLHREVFDPLGMATARLTGFDGPQATGHRDGKPVPHWHNRIAGSGGVEATAQDLAAYASAILAPPDRRLRAAVEMTLQSPALGWGRHDDVFAKNGGTGGFHSMLAFDATRTRAVGMVVAASGLDDIDRAVLHVLRGGDPAAFRREPVDDSWGDLALGLVPALVDRRWADLRTAMTPSAADALTDERLHAASGRAFGSLGDHLSTRFVRAVRTANSIRVELELTCAEGQAAATMTFFEDSRALAGLRIWRR